MASDAKIEGNRRNSQYSTGPRTESGKSKSSRNRLTFGLYTHNDYVKPGESEIYEEFCRTMYHQLTPANLLEETLVFAITGASWRLRRCAAAEADLADFRDQDPLLDDETDKTRRGIERARAAAHIVINRSLNQLRKLQTERISRQHTGFGGVDDSLAAEGEKIAAAIKRAANVQQQAADEQFEQMMAQAMSVPDAPGVEELERMLEERRAEKELGSNCSDAQPEGHVARVLARYALCPCKSGLIVKDCCEKNSAQSQEKAA
jgi:uncharacterized protein YoaH (UPF0181 family)